MTQEQLSLASGVDRAYLSELENGLRSPSVEVLMRLCEAMQTSAGLLIGRLEGVFFLREEDAENGSVTCAYDADGRVVAIADAHGRVPKKATRAARKKN